MYIHTVLGAIREENGEMEGNNTRVARTARAAGVGIMLGREMPAVTPVRG